MQKWFNRTIQTDVLVIALVTLLLQTISFVTTYQGAKVYIGDIFPLASLFFAIAIQFCVWFFSNTSKNHKNFFRTGALLAAVCCSTWFSYTGIYTIVNSPLLYLENRYHTIRDELTVEGNETVNAMQAQLLQELTEAADQIAGENTALESSIRALEAEKERLDRCRTELDALSENGNGGSYSSSMRAPAASQFETYEEYAAAYQAYVQAVSASTGVESAGSRAQLLESYGFADIMEYEAAVSTNLQDLTAAQQLAQKATVDAETLLQTTQGICLQAIAGGVMPSEAEQNEITQLFLASGTTDQSGQDFMSRLQLCVEYQAHEAMPDMSTLLTEYGIRDNSMEEAMELEMAMNFEAAEEARELELLWNHSEKTLPDLSMTPVYLLPSQALQFSTDAGQAWYCLFIAALIDGMTLILAGSLRKRQPVWNRKWRLQPDFAVSVPDHSGTCLTQAVLLLFL